MARRTRFGTWCARDINDETKIVYTFRMMDADGKKHTEHFTSDDTMEPGMMYRLREAWIDTIHRDSDAWIASLYEDGT